MEDQKIENLLNLALSATPEEREKSYICCKKRVDMECLVILYHLLAHFTTKNHGQII